MKPKAILTVALLGFVGLGLATIVMKEARARATSSTAVPAPPTTAEASATDQVRFVAYYFHGEFRCVTCKAIQSQSQAAITTYFAAQPDNPGVEWREVNFDEPANAHFRDDFALAFQSLVLVEEQQGKVLRWKNLSDVWTKIHGTPRDFEQYVVESTSSFVAGDAS